MRTEMANIFNIQRFSIHDGPGIRSTVFFKGCNLRCKWCHNPESFQAFSQLECIEKNCIGCGRCIEVCTDHAITFKESKVVTDRTACTRCFKCVEVCPVTARKKLGKEMSIQEVVDTVTRDIAYYKNSGGGVTLSGGEPLLWADFTTQTLKELKEREIHTAVETALNVRQEILEKVLPYTDLWLCDFKVFNEDKHKEATGVSNQVILDNFKYLAQKGAQLLVRIPIIPHINDDQQNLLDTLNFLKTQTNFRRIELLKFHKLAESKYENLSIDYPAKEYVDLEEENFKYLKKIIQDSGFICV